MGNLASRYKTRTRRRSKDAPFTSDPRRPSFAYNHYRHAFKDIKSRVLTKERVDHLNTQATISAFSVRLVVLLRAFDRDTLNEEAFNFTCLTDWAESSGRATWSELNQLRMELMIKVRHVARDVLSKADGIEDTIVMLNNGSDERCSDLDVSICGPRSADLCLVMAY